VKEGAKFIENERNRIIKIQNFVTLKIVNVQTVRTE